MERRLRGIWLGRRRYEPVLDWLRRLHEARRAGDIGDTVVLLEHEPVITFGRAAHSSHLLAPESELARRGIDRVTTDRGGDVTLHAPGQLVIYPVVDLAPDRRDVRRWVHDLIETMRRVVLPYGVEAGPVPGLIGLWTDRRAPHRWSAPSEAGELAKLGAIGVRISRWVTLHGSALNLTTDLDLYQLIVPCGIREHGVTSVAELVGTRPDLREAAASALTALGDILGAETEGLEDREGEELERCMSG